MTWALSYRSNALGPLRRPEAVRRPWFLRRALFLGLAASLALFAALIAARALSPDGPGYGLYWLHDRVWLPFRAYLHDWAAPWSLTWVLTGGMFAVLAIIEWLGFAAPLRRLQHLVCRWLVSSSVGRALLGRFPGPAGRDRFLQTVLQAEIRGGKARIKRDLLSGTDPDRAVCHRLSGHLALRSVRKADRGALLMDALEALVLIRVSSAPGDGSLTDLVVRLRDDMGGASSDAAGFVTDLWASEPADESPAAILGVLQNSVRDLERDTETPATCLLLLAAAHLHHTKADGRSLVLPWLSAWRRARLRAAVQGGPAPEHAPPLDVEFWTAWLERQASEHRPEGLISAALSWTRSRDHGEVFAATGPAVIRRPA